MRTDPEYVPVVDGLNPERRFNVLVFALGLKPRGSHSHHRDCTERGIGFRIIDPTCSIEYSIIALKVLRLFHFKEYHVSLNPLDVMALLQIRAT